MCGRYSLLADAELLYAFLQISGPRLNLRQRWNIAPTQEAPVMRLHEGARQLAMLAWGLVPYWAEDRSIGSRMINARSETAAEKPAFRAAYRARRCLVPADAFYEWPETADVPDRRPKLFRRSDGGPFTFAGLWESWVPAGGGVLETFTILSCAAAGSWMVGFHSRTPVVIAPADFDFWLDPKADPRALLRPPPDGLFSAIRVSTYVNKTTNDDSNCFTPATEDVPEEPAPKKRSKPVDDRQTSLF